MTDDTTDDSIALDDDGAVTLPIVDVLTGRGFITGKSGSGKSNSASVVVEELLDRGFPVLIVDTDGEYWGLKETYEVLHVGADEECDLQVGPEHADRLATLALEEGVPIILDVSGYLDGDVADELVRDVAHALFTKEKKRKQPFLMLVEEVHEYIPQDGGLDETGEMLIQVAKRGRKHGLGLTGISQRPASVDKDFITQADWLLWHRLSWENDVKTVRRVIDKETADAVGDLADGEAFLQADFREAAVERISVRRKRTYDAGATPDLDDFERPELKSISEDLVGDLEEISAEHERRQDRVAELEAEVERLESEKAELAEDLEDAKDMTDMASQFTEAMMQAGGDSGAASEKVDDLIEERNDLQRRLEEREKRIDDLDDQVADLQQELDQRPEIGERANEAVAVLAEEFGVAEGGDEALQRKLKSARERIEALESEKRRIEASADVEISETIEAYEDFLDLDAVQAEIKAAKDEATCSERYIRGVLASIIGEGGPVHYDDIAERLGVSTTTDVSKASSELERRKIITKDSRTDGTYVDLNTDGIAEIRRAAAEREKTEQLMEEL